MNLKNLEKALEGESSYRLKQAKSAVFQKLIEDWMEVTALPRDLRERLNAQCHFLIKAETFASKEKDSVKARITLDDGLKIESVLMRHIDGRNTVCVSSQVGCSLSCKFCATGKMGFGRNLEAWEIVEQVIFFARYLKKDALLRPNFVPPSPRLRRASKATMDRQDHGGRGINRVTNVVFMGMGEPFLNYENAMKAIRILNDKDGLDIGARNISISTAGITEGIKRLSEEKLQVNLAISLHAPNDKLRAKIMPVNKKYPVGAIFKAVDNYIAKTKRKVMFEYLLIKGINDSDSCAIELARMMQKPLYFLNLILYNPTGVFEPPSFDRVKKFKSILRKRGVKFSERHRFGQNIKAACGQFFVGRQ